MNKSELIEKIAEKAGITKSEATKVLNAALDVIAEALESGERVTLLNKFGSFKVPPPVVRTGRNPRSTARRKFVSAKKAAAKPPVKFPAPVAKKAAPKTAVRAVRKAPAKAVAKISNGPTGGGGPGKKE